MSLIFPGAAAAPSADQHAAALRTANSSRILVVNDDPRVFRSLRRILEADGHRVTVADRGQPGIDAFLAAVQRCCPLRPKRLKRRAGPSVDSRSSAPFNNDNQLVSLVVLNAPRSRS